jgi:DNA-directed RNA polymerase specialized sigma24 family protein
MSSQAMGSITRYIGDVKHGAPDAVQGLWERYFERLVRLARARLRATPRAAADEEDVALSAFDSFVAAARRGRFPKPEDRDDLWKILVTITVRKAHDLAAYERRRQPRDGRRRLTEADVAGEGDVLSLIAGPDPSPDFAVSVAEECGRLLDALGDDVLRRIALGRLAGYKDAEIAARLGRSRQTVMRKLRRIRDAWQAEVGGCAPTR